MKKPVCFTKIWKVPVCIAALILLIAAGVFSLHFATEAQEKTGLEQLVYAFLTAKEADFQSEEHLSLAEFYAPEVRDTLEGQTSWLVFRLEKLVRWSIVEDILWERFDFQIHDIEIRGTTALIHATESYEYELSFAEGTVSARSTAFAISCEKSGGEWFITDISTDNMFESLVAGHSVDELPGLLGLT